MIFSTIKKKLITTQALYLSMLIGCLAMGSSSAAQAPANDNPCQAIELTPASTCTYETFTNQSATTSSGMAAPGCASFTSGTSADVWFKAVVPANGALTFDMQRGTMTDGGMAVYRGNSCSLLSRIACDDNSSTNTNMPKLTVTGQTPGSTVYVRVWAANNVNGTFGICATIPVAAPANDEPCTAIELRANATCDFREFTNEAATNSQNILDPGCGGYLGGDVWFKVVVPAGGAIIVRTQAGVMLDGGMALYTGGACNATLSLLGCNDNTSTTNLMPSFTAGGLNPGDTVWIRMYENGNNNNGTFSICVTLPPPPPANDGECAAIELPVGATCNFQQFTNADATASGLVPVPGCGNYLGGDVWFKFVVPAGGAVSINTQTGVMTDGAMALYSGNCRALTLITCATAGAGGNMPRIVAGGLTPGDTLWIRMWEEGNNNNGTFSICVSEPPPPPANDGQCAAVELPVNASCVFQQFTNADATASSGAPAPGCGNYQGGDVWFKFVVPAGGAASISTQAGVMTDGAMALYRGNCQSLTLVSCATTGAGGNMPRINAGGLTPGDTLWVRVWEEGNDNNGTFSICVSIPLGAPANDDPCNAIQLTPATTCTYQTFTNENATGSTGVPAPGCADYQGGDVWFKVVVPAGGGLIFDTQTGVITDGGMAIYSGSCGALSLIECDDDDSPNGVMPFISAGGLTPGDTIWVRVWEFGGDNNGTFGICVRIPPPPPSNDNPCNAIELPVSETCNFQTFTNENATGSTGVPAPGCANYQGGDVWFKVVVPASGALVFDSQTGVITDGGMAIYSGTCGNLSLIECDDDGSQNGAMSFITRNDLTPGDTIWIRMWEYGGDGNGTFGICVKTPPPPPANDNPCQAITLPVNQTCTFQTFTNESASGTTGVPAPGCANYLGGDVWFNVIVPASGSVQITTQAGVVLNGGMAVYSGSSCGALTLQTCNDDGTGNGLMPKITLGGLTPGDTLWVRFWETGNDNNGTFGICATIPPPPPTNDEPCNAIELTPGTTCTYQTFSTSNSTSTLGVPAPGCANYQGGDVWFKVVVPAGGSLIFNTQTGGTGNVLDGGMAIYKGSCGQLSLIECDDDDSQNGLMPYIEGGGLNPGDTIWIRVWEKGNDLAGNFGICVTVPATPPANDNPCNAISLTPANTCTYQTFTNAGAIGTTGVPAPGCAGYQGGDVWFRVVVPAQGGIIVDTKEGVMIDGGMALYVGRCDSLVLVSCDDNNSVNGDMPTIYATGLTPGTIAWLRVWENGNNNNGTFGICVTIPPAQPSTISLSCPKDTTIDCGTCFSLTTTVPNIHNATDRYVVNKLSGSGNCFRPYVGTEDVGPSTNLNTDDVYTGVIALPFSFPFFGQNYNALVASTNGYLSFDLTRATLFSHYQILNNANALSATAGTPLDLPSQLYDRALIMGPYHDINPATTTSPTRKIKYNVTGIAPNRRWILSFNKVPMYNCNNLINSSHQIVLYEGSGMIEVFVFEKEICTTWNDGRAMIGIQNFDRNQAVMVPTRRASDPRWGGTNLNESWRFTPVAGRTLYKRVELYDTLGNLMAVGDTSSIDEANLRVRFDRVCPSIQTVGVTPYIVKTFYERFDDPNGEVVSTDTINIRRNSVLNVRYDITDPSCTAANGAIVAHATGTAPYRFSIDSGATYQTDSSFVNLAAGTYNITIADGAGCRRDTTIELIPQSRLTATYTVTPVICNGATGTLQVHVVTGTAAPYTFSVDGGTTFQADSLFNLAAGTYAVKILDGNNCSKDTSITISQPSAIRATVDVTAATCTVAATAVIHAEGGSPGYLFANDATNFGADSVFTLTSGANVLTIKDANGCLKDTTIVVATPSAITLAATMTPVSCNGGNNGSINVTVTNATNPVTYSINASPFSSANTFANLAAGSYNIIVRDANGCSKDTTIEVTQPAALAATYVVNQALCGRNGSVAITAAGGTADYLYSSDGTYSSSNSFSLPVGTYTISVKDANGCTKDTSVQIIATGAVNATYTVNNVSCSGGNDASIVINANGTAPYQYSVSTGAAVYGTSETFNNLPSGTYNVSVLDANGCSKDTVITITEPTPITGSYAITNVTCNGGNNGVIVVAAAGGTPGYTYSIDGTNFVASGSFAALAQGTYTVRIKDAKGCTKDTTIQVTQPAAISLSTVVNAVSCNGGNNGSFTVTASGGTGVYEYSSNGGTTYQPGNSFGNLVAGTYQLRVRDANGCTKDSAIEIVQPAALTLTNVANNATCSPTGNGQVTVTANGGTGTYIYSQDNFATTSTSNLFSGLAQGNYVISVRDANGCTATTSANIGFTFDLVLTGRADTAICDNAGVVLYTNSNAQSFSWTPSTGLSSTSTASPVASPANTTTYVLTATTGSCELKDTVTITVSAPPLVFAGNDVEVIKGGDASIFASVDNAVSYVWSPTTYLNNPNSLSPVAVMPQQTTTYRLTATNNLGCSNYDEVKVTVIPYCIKPKNAFSPNGDGINDTWSVYDQYECLQNVRVRVFNRYGSKVFESNNYRNDWKGTFGGSPLPDATYYFVIDYTLFNGEPLQIRGDVTILR